MKRLKRNFALAFVLTSGVVAAQMSGPAANQLIRQAILTELNSPYATENCIYRYQRQVSGKWEVFKVIKTRQIVIDRLIEVDGRKLNPAQEDAEDERLAKIISDRGKLNGVEQKERDDEQRLRRLLTAVPDAFLWISLGAEHAPKTKLIRLSFTPNPNFRPSSPEERILSAMRGTVEIDSAAKQIVKFETSLFRDVNFGWGIVIHLSKGGHMLLERSPEEAMQWSSTSLSLQFSARVLVIKKFNPNWKFDQFTCTAGEVTVAQAVDLLRTPQAISRSSPLETRPLPLRSRRIPAGDFGFR